MISRRKSKKREAILNCLRSTTSHPSAEWIYQQLKPELPDLSLGTVYRNLALFQETGDAVLVTTADGKERYDGNVIPHAHFICEQCSAVVDLDIPVDHLHEKLEQQYGFRILRNDLLFHGICSQCCSGVTSGAPNN